MNQYQPCAIYRDEGHHSWLWQDGMRFCDYCGLTKVFIRDRWEEPAVSAVRYRFGVVEQPYSVPATT